METKRKDKETERVSLIRDGEEKAGSERINAEVINLIYFPFIIYFLFPLASVEIYS